MDPEAVVSSRVCSANLFAALGQVTMAHPPAATFEELDALLDTLQRYVLKLHQQLFNCCLSVVLWLDKGDYPNIRIVLSLFGPNEQRSFHLIFCVSILY